MPGYEGKVSVRIKIREIVVVLFKVHSKVGRVVSVKSLLHHSASCYFHSGADHVRTVWPA